MIRRVLIPLDGSEMAESIVDRLGFLLRQSGAAITLLHTVDPSQLGLLTSAAVASSAIADDMLQQNRQYLDRVAGKLRERGLEVTARCETGAAADEILAVADDEHSSVICLSTHGRSGLGRWVYGSVTEKVLRVSKRPLLVVPSFDRGTGKLDEREWHFESVVVPIDGSAEALQIAPHLAEGVRLFGYQVTVLHVLPANADDTAVSAAEIRLQNAAEHFKNAGVPVTTALGRGDPAAELLDYAPRHQHDMIAMTTHGRSGLSRWVMGSVAEKTLRSATVPVLVVRSQEAAASD